MGARSHLSRSVVLALLLLPASVWAEYCTSQGQNPLPRKEAKQYEDEAWLGPSEIVASQRRHLPWGLPEPQCLRPAAVPLYHREYVVCYDLSRKVALWVSYRLESNDLDGVTRLNAFRTDPRVALDENPRCADYQSSGFQRGHLVPSADMSRSRPTQANTFFLTNMAPQYGHLNSRAWGTLEDYVRAWAKKYGHVHVLTGSVFDRDGDGQPDALGQTRWTKPSKRVGVPSHFFKIVVREAPGGELITLAVLLPNKSKGLGKGETFLRQNLTSVARIRRASGTDFLPDLSAATKTQLEQAVTSELWPRN